MVGKKRRIPGWHLPVFQPLDGAGGRTRIPAHSSPMWGQARCPELCLLRPVGNSGAGESKQELECPHSTRGSAHEPTFHLSSALREDSEYLGTSSCP